MSIMMGLVSLSDVKHPYELACLCGRASVIFILQPYFQWDGLSQLSWTLTVLGHRLKYFSYCTISWVYSSTS